METLLIIDPQNDFVDPKGSLYIPGAEKGIEEICKFIKEKNPSHIIISQDTHQAVHIGHAMWWKPMPEEFTTITLQDIKNGIYSPRFFSTQRDVAKYINALPGKKHNIWPDHCLEGSWGWCFPDSLIQSLNDWSFERHGKKYEIVQKGMNSNREMYSVFSYADSDPSILKHNTLLNHLKKSDKIYISGFAKDVCVAYSVKDILESGIKDFNNKLIFLDSCMTALDNSADILSVYKDCETLLGAKWE